ncbi:MAG: helix-turn-helix transcriptional regulator [Caulobacterales bacterium]|nr:helix-turn-helix transcriptional regulator [Caulobacterales bacterium]
MIPKAIVVFSKTVKRVSRADGASKVGVCQIASFNPQAVSRAKRALPDAAQIAAAAERVGALGNLGRFSLILALDGRELCVCDCAQVLGGSVPAASQHLKELRRLGAITFRTAGKMAYYRIADPRWVALARAAVALLQPFSAQVAAT